MASNALSSASGIICASCMLIYIFVMWSLWLKRYYLTCKSVYKWSMIAILVTQSIGVVFLVFKVDKYWTQKLSEWKESRISFLSSGRRSRAHLHNSKNFIISFCIGFQKVVVVSCKKTGLLPIVVLIPFVYFSQLSEKDVV
ncbi:hypothetical protein Hanom_Chr06g00509611 [Helianthus anomalus]